MEDKNELLNAGRKESNEELITFPVSDEDSKVLAMVMEDITAAKRLNDEKIPQWEEFYQLYRAKSIGTEREGRSQVVSSDVMDAVEWILPQMMRLFFSRQNVVICNPTGEEDVRNAEMFTKLLNYQFFKGMNGFEKSYLWMKAAFIWGSGVGKLTWTQQYREEPFEFAELPEEDFLDLQSDPAVEILQYDREVEIAPAPSIFGVRIGSELETVRYKNIVGKRVIKTFEGPQFEVIPLEDFYIDPTASCIEDAKFCVHRVFRTLDELYRMQDAGVYKNVEKIEAWVNTPRGETADYVKAQRAAEFGQSPPWSFLNSSQKGRKEVEVWEYWGQLDLDDSGKTEPYLVVVAGDTILRKEKNPYNHGRPPFVILRPSLVPFQFDGVGMGHLIGDFQKAKTSILRQMLDNLSFINNQMWIVDRNQGVEMESLLNPRPGGVVRTDRVDAVRPVTPQPLQQVSIMALEFIQTQIEQRHGITRYNQGLDARSLNKTATGVSLIMNASQQRIELIGRIFAETGFKPLFKMMVSLNQQFISEGFTIRLFNEPVRFEPDDLRGEFDIDVEVGANVALEEQRQQQMMTLLQMAPQLIQLGLMMPEHVYHVVASLLRSWGYKDVNAYIINPVEQVSAQPGLQGGGADIMQLLASMGGSPNGGGTTAEAVPSQGAGASPGPGLPGAMAGNVPVQPQGQTFGG